MLDFSDRAVILAVAAGIEAVVAYPDPLFRTIGHPVTWIGNLITLLERIANRAGSSFAARRAAGLMTELVLVTVAAAVGFALQAIVVHASLLGQVVAVAAVAVLIAGGNLDRHVGAVAAALAREGVTGGRREVAKIVGRDPDTLDESAVCRAAIESLAENASDGVAAPAFWFLVAGLPGMIAYKTINTADSMIGHLSERYRAFGWAAARLDDLVNLPASRLTGLLLVAAAAVVPGASPAGAWRALRRDARRHRSPNAGWPEAAMAGALGLRLAGPRVYGGTRVDDAWMGEGRVAATGDDITRALRLYRVAFAGALALVFGLGFVLALAV